MTAVKEILAPSDFGIYGGNALDRSFAGVKRFLAEDFGPFAAADVLVNNGSQVFKANVYDLLFFVSPEIKGGRLMFIARLYASAVAQDKSRRSFSGPPHLGCQPLVMHTAYSAQELSRIFERETIHRIKEWLEECRAVYDISEACREQTIFVFRPVKIIHPKKQWVLVFLEPVDLSMEF